MSKADLLRASLLTPSQVCDLMDENEHLREENTRLKNTIIQMGKTIHENKDMWEYFSSRFVKVSTCTTEMKADCGMFQEGYCEGERCMEWVDLVALLDKATEEGGVK